MRSQVPEVKEPGEGLFSSPEVRTAKVSEQLVPEGPQNSSSVPAKSTVFRQAAGCRNLSQRQRNEFERRHV